MAQTWRASTYSESIKSQLFEVGATFTVHSVHDRACNLVTARGDMITLVAAKLGNGPFHVTVSSNPFASMVAGDHLINQKGTRLTWREHLLDLNGAANWSPAVQWPTKQIAEPARDYLSAAAEKISLVDLFSLTGGASTSVQNVILNRVHSGLAHLDLGLKKGDPAHFYDGACLLAGLGPGLTPAGDDLLLGIMAGIWLMESASPTNALFEQHNAAIYCQSICDAASARTTHLSRNWLLYAMQNQFGQSWHSLARACAHSAQETDKYSAVCEAVSVLISVGETSGRAAFYGFVFALKYQ